MFITWSGIRSRFSFSATSVTCDIWSFKTSHLISTMKRCQTLFTTRISILQTLREITVFREAFQEFLSSIKHTQTKPPISFHWYGLLYYLQSVCGSRISTMSRIYAGTPGVQILAEAIELSLLQNIQTSSSTQPASNSMKTRPFSLAVKWPGQTVWPLTSI